ncbi:hypothetical protein FRC01_011435, partial [Tulasnella sp. 417]
VTRNTNLRRRNPTPAKPTTLSTPIMARHHQEVGPRRTQAALRLTDQLCGMDLPRIRMALAEASR